MKLRKVNKKTKQGLVDSIFKILDVDITEQTRKREVITGRMIYYVLLRDMNYSWASIGRSVGKNHATIISAYQTFEDLIDYDYELQESLQRVKEDFYDRNNEHPFKFVSRMKLECDAIDLEKQNKKLTLDINELKLELQRYQKYSPILDVLRINHTLVQEVGLRTIEKKLNHFLNELHHKRHR